MDGRTQPLDATASAPARRVVAAHFVATDDGTGIVHIAPAFGEDDYALGRTEGLLFLQPVGLDGRFVGGPWAGEFVKENLNVAKEYVELITGGDVKAPEEIPPDTGAVIRRGLKKIACYRDPQGALHERSAICTHLDCVVHWNDLEKTWDCPCHGSRFDPLGQVVNGPANTNLPIPAKE